MTAKLWAQSGQPFNAQRSFGARAEYLDPDVQAFADAVTESLSEFTGQIVTDELIDRINDRVMALQKIATELMPE
jgi:hypothetical protein